MKDVMVDLETMGCGYRAAIVSIGAARFDPIADEVGETFYQRISLVSAQEAGCAIDAETVLWWLRQEEAARREIITGISFPTALLGFAEFLGKGSRVWGNGSNFDNRILRDAYELIGARCPWHYRDDRDMRTFLDLAKKLGIVAIVKFKGLKHHAMHDAIYQAKIVCELYQRLFKD